MLVADGEPGRQASYNVIGQPIEDLAQPNRRLATAGEEPPPLEVNVGQPLAGGGSGRCRSCGRSRSRAGRVSVMEFGHGPVRKVDRRPGLGAGRPGRWRGEVAISGAKGCSSWLVRGSFFLRRWRRPDRDIWKIGAVHHLRLLGCRSLRARPRGGAPPARVGRGLDLLPRDDEAAAAVIV